MSSRTRLHDATTAYRQCEMNFPIHGVKHFSLVEQEPKQNLWKQGSAIWSENMTLDSRGRQTRRTRSKSDWQSILGAPHRCEPSRGLELSYASGGEALQNGTVAPFTTVTEIDVKLRFSDMRCATFSGSSERCRSI